MARLATATELGAAIELEVAEGRAAAVIPYASMHDTAVVSRYVKQTLPIGQQYPSMFATEQSKV